MSTYSYFTQFNLLDQELTPPMYRQPNFISWLNALSSPLQFLQDEIFSNSYVNGSLAATYSNTTTYTPGDQVLYLNRQVWINLATASGIPPTINATQSWYLYNQDYIGAEERVRYNSQVLLFEYALNRFFQTGVTPIVEPFNPGGIYIQGLSASLNRNPFLMGQTSLYSSTMRNSGTGNQNAYLGNAPFSGNLNFNGFTIFVPIAIANSLSTASITIVPIISSASNVIIRSFSDDYVLAGQQYNVATY